MSAIVFSAKFGITPSNSPTFFLEYTFFNKKPVEETTPYVAEKLKNWEGSLPKIAKIKKLSKEFLSF